ncbi:hypothetical protein AX17_001772 [Amanita inopinata Kibby_2008]|nr:hypothetical protein AX17_001772 [Amanita inopinata Kibby_2008]
MTAPYYNPTADNSQPFDIGQPNYFESLPEPYLVKAHSRRSTEGVNSHDRSVIGHTVSFPGSHNPTSHSGQPYSLGSAPHFIPNDSIDPRNGPLHEAYSQRYSSWGYNDMSDYASASFGSQSNPTVPSLMVDPYHSDEADPQYALSTSQRFDMYSPPFSSPLPHGYGLPQWPSSRDTLTPSSTFTQSHSAPPSCTASPLITNVPVDGSGSRGGNAGSREQSPAKSDPDQNDPKRRFPCLILGCSRRFTSQYTLRVHMEAHKPKPKAQARGLETRKNM